MKDALNNQIQVGDYVAYANRHGMMIVRVSRLEEYRAWIDQPKVRIVGKYAIKWHSSQSWSKMNNGHVRPLHLPNHALVISHETLPDSLIELLG